MIVSNLKIVEYRLRSSVFMLKGNRIPGFIEPDLLQVVRCTE